MYIHIKMTMDPLQYWKEKPILGAGEERDRSDAPDT